MSAERALRAARFLAEHWREQCMRDGSLEVPWRLAAHPLCCVLSALDGEEDPEQLGINPDAWGAFMRALESRSPLRTRSSK